MDHQVYVLSATEIGPNTHRIVIERPAGYEVFRGQATDVAIDEDGWWDKARPIHFRRSDDPECLEFVMFTYTDADPVARRFARLQRGDRLVITDAWAEDVPNVFYGGWRRPQVLPAAPQMPAAAHARSRAA